MAKENKVVTVSLSGGLIGLLASNPRESLAATINYENSKGWHVLQIIDDATGNLIVYILRILILLITLGLYTKANGYFIIFEREVSSVSAINTTQSDIDVRKNFDA